MIQLTAQEIFDACKAVLSPPNDTATMDDFDEDERKEFDRFVALLNNSLAVKQSGNA